MQKLAKNHGLTALQYHFLFNAHICAGSDGKILNDQEKNMTFKTYCLLKHIQIINRNVTAGNRFSSSDLVAKH